MEVRTTSTRYSRSPYPHRDLQALLKDLPRPVDDALIADVLAECTTPGETLIVGVTGSVAVGKSTLCAAIAGKLRSTMRVEIVSTDGFLFPNSVLTERGLLTRKGYPESYNMELLSGVLQRVRLGPVIVPGYSHTIYDRASDLDRVIDRPDILIVEGLGLSPTGKQRDAGALLDLLIYIDASEEFLEEWFVRRFMAFWREAENNPTSFYTRFRTMTSEAAEAFARQVWTSINLPNLREHIALAKAQADLLISKSSGHRMTLSLPGFHGHA